MKKLKLFERLKGKRRVGSDPSPPGENTPCCDVAASDMTLAQESKPAPRQTKQKYSIEWMKI